jgi:glycosyltransferase involved in cell wall biosynthesis
LQYFNGIKTGGSACGNAEKSDTPLDRGNPLTVEIFIICHNRPGQAKEAIQSVLNQNSSDYQLIVSDNSSNDTVGEMVRTHFPSVEYRRRPSALPALAHFNACISEAAADYFCLFHDDDTMREDFVSNVAKAIALHPTAVAFGTNACVVNIPANSKSLSFLCLGPFEQISSPEDLFRRYYGRYHTGIAPFPGYVYQTAKIEGKRIPEDGGKYADVSWLLTVAASGRIVWITKPLMDYYLHGGNDGLQESLHDRLRLLGFLERNKTLCGGRWLADYRYFIHKQLVASLPAVRYGKRLKIIKRDMNRHRLCRLFRGKDYFFMIQRAVIKNLMKQKECG